MDAYRKKYIEEARNILDNNEFFTFRAEMILAFNINEMNDILMRYNLTDLILRRKTWKPKKEMKS